MKEDIQDIIDDFALFDDWEDRYAYLIDLGKKIEGLDDSEKRDDLLVRGCTSKVWLVMSWDHKGGQDTPCLSIRADSDAHIVRGLVALVMRIYNGCGVDDVLSIDMEAAFREIGLEAHLSPSRRNGFFSMIETIRGSARMQKAAV